MATQRHRFATIALATSTLLGALLAAPAHADTTLSAAQSSAVITGTSGAPVLSRAVARRLPVAAPVARTVPSTVTKAVTGSRAPRTSPAGWREVYAEDFDTPVATGAFPSGGYAKHWGVYDDGWPDTSRQGTYMPSKVLSVHGGALDYSIRTENGKHLVAAPWLLDTKGKTYGRFSIRFRSDALPGYKTAWLLWPDSEQWPADGEIDFPEGGLGPKDTISAFSHYARSSGGQAAFETGATYLSWHTVTVEWAPGRVTFFLDGARVGTTTTAVPRNPMHWVLQTETNLDGYAPSAAVRGHVLVDWVAYWARA